MLGYFAGEAMRDSEREREREKEGNKEQRKENGGVAAFALSSPPSVAVVVVVKRPLGPGLSAA